MGECSNLGPKAYASLWATVMVGEHWHGSAPHSSAPASAACKSQPSLANDYPNGTLARGQGGPSRGGGGVGPKPLANLQLKPEKSPWPCPTTLSPRARVEELAWDREWGSHLSRYGAGIVPASSADTCRGGGAQRGLSNNTGNQPLSVKPVNAGCGGNELVMGASVLPVTPQR